MTETEEWRAIPSLEGRYEASSAGRIKSISRMVDRHIKGVPAPFPIVGRVRKFTINRQTGYATVGIKRGASSHAHPVHILVCEAFHGERPEGLEVAHCNGIKTDNSASNLRWATHAENMAEKFAHGTVPVGERHWNSRLKETQVAEIRRMRSAGHLYKEIARSFEISETMARNIATYKRRKMAAAA